jgi:hypothetical protein
VLWHVDVDDVARDDDAAESLLVAAVVAAAVDEVAATLRWRRWRRRWRRLREAAELGARRFLPADLEVLREVLRGALSRLPFGRPRGRRGTDGSRSRSTATLDELAGGDGGSGGLDALVALPEAALVAVVLGDDERGADETANAERSLEARARARALPTGATDLTVLASQTWQFLT